MDDPGDVTLPEEYFHIPLRAVNIATRRKMANFLNLEGSLVVVEIEGGECDVVNDVTGLAEIAGFQYQEIMNMKIQRNPTIEFLDQWTSRNATVGHLWRFLYLMERYDVLSECRQNLIKDCRRYEDQQDIARQANLLEIEQDPTVSTSEMKVDETKFATLDDVKSGNQATMYDAFISYSPKDPEDCKFVFQMIDVLEDQRGLKLFVPGRDDIPGAAKHVISAYLIEKRCKRVAIVLSKSFLKSPSCDFQVRFAQALAPGARSKRLIPIIREKNTQLPRILRFLAVCDFSREDMTEWVWDRLYTAMLAPIGPVTYFDDDDHGNQDLKEMTYPVQHRLEIPEMHHLTQSQSSTNEGDMAVAEQLVSSGNSGSGLVDSVSSGRRPEENSTLEPQEDMCTSMRHEASISQECKPKPKKSKPFTSFFKKSNK